MIPSRTLFSGPATVNVGRAVSRALAGSSSPATNGLRCSYHLLNTRSPPSRRHFSSTSPTRLDYFEPPKNAPSIKLTPPAWHHPIYNEQDMNNIKVAHRESETYSDWVALGLCRMFRKAMDLSTGYRHDPTKPYVMSERKWMVRFVFLETIAGVPGMCAGMLRHLSSLRRMNRDNGWIETLLEEAYNERMHLLTFLKMAEPGLFMKLMILGAQGVFFNGFFLSYLMSPKTCHRFVGYIEEEAVKTYTLAIQDIDEGRLPAWKTLQAPEIAIRYWNMPEGHQTMRDLLMYIRADEAKHREVNHTLGNLDPKQDPNPFVSEYEDQTKPHPSKGIENIKPIGWDRKEVI